MKKYINKIIIILFSLFPLLFFIFLKHDLLRPLFYLLGLLTLPFLLFRSKLALTASEKLTQQPPLFFALSFLMDLGYLAFAVVNFLFKLPAFERLSVGDLPWGIAIFSVIYNLPNLVASFSLFKYAEEYHKMYKQIKQSAGMSMLYVLGIYFGDLVKNLFLLHLGHLVLSKLPNKRKKYNQMKMDNIVNGIKTQMPFNRSQEKEIRRIMQNQLNTIKLSDYNQIYGNLFSPNLDFLIMKKLNRILESRAKQQMFKMKRGGMKGAKIIRR